MTENSPYHVPEDAPLKVQKTPKMLAIEERFGKPIDVLLSEMYGSGMSLRDVGNEVGINFMTISRWLQAYGVSLRARDDGIEEALRRRKRHPLKTESTRVQRRRNNVRASRYAEVMGILWREPQGLSKLPEKQKRVIYERFLGSDDLPILSLEEVGHNMGFTRQRVKQLEDQALKNLRNSDPQVSSTL